MKRISIKVKITLWYTLVMIIISSVVLYAMTSIGKDMVTRDIEKKIVDAVSDLSMQAVERNGKRRPVPEFKYYNSGVHMALYDGSYNKIGGNTPFGITDEFEFSNNILRKNTYNGSEYYEFDREIRTPRSDTVYWVKGIVSVSEETFAVDSVMRNNTILTVILLLTAAIGGYLIVSRAFVPVTKIRKTAEEISKSSDLSRRINLGSGKDELYSLANTFDNMLDKIESSFEREKQFTSDASHELRTPVAVILSECEYMTDCAKTADEYKESAESVKKQAEKMSKLISELLTISRMDKKTLQINFEETDISELLYFVCEEQREIQRKDIEFVTDIKPQIFAQCDRFLMARLFINLISNAFQYTQKGSVSVSLTEDEKNVCFTVEDTGIGIGEENLPKIWERFYQADTARTSSESSGAGLGLSMVKWIADCHNGSVSAESKQGEGSKFTFCFPKNK